MASKPVARIVQTHKHTFLLQDLHKSGLFYITDRIVRDDKSNWHQIEKTWTELDQAKLEVDQRINWDRIQKEAIANNPKVQRKVVYPI